MLTDVDGQEVAGTRPKYYAYGAPRGAIAATDHDNFALAYTVAIYTGQYRDSNADLIYYGARFVLGEVRLSRLDRPACPACP